MESSVTGHFLGHSEIELNLFVHVLWLIWIPNHNFVLFFYMDLLLSGRSQWPRGLRRGSSIVRLLGLWARIPPGHGCMSYMLFVVRKSSLHPADDPSTGVPPNVVCLNVIVEPRQWEGPDPPGAFAPWKGGGANLYSFLSAVQSVYLTVKATACLT